MFTNWQWWVDRPSLRYIQKDSWSKNSNDSGIVIILLAVIILTLLLIVGLFLDTNIYMMARRDRENIANLISSAALSEISRSAEEDRARKATERAESLASSNLQLKFTSAFYKTPEAQSQNYELLQDTEDGKMSLGRWHFLPTIRTTEEGLQVCDGGEPCPCLNGNWNGPCFETIPNLQRENLDNSNAVFSFLKSKAQNPLSTIFMRLGGIEELQVESQATIALKPLNVVFLLDLSDFVDEETHIPYELTGIGRVDRFPVTGPGGSFIPFDFNPSHSAYRLSTPANCAASEPYLIPYNDAGFDRNQLTCRTKNDDAELSSPPNAIPNNPISPSNPSSPTVLDTYKLFVHPELWPSNCELDGGNSWSRNWHNTSFNWWSFSQPFSFYTRDRHPTQPSSYHGRSDYRCFNPDFSDIDGNAAPPQPHIVDSYRGATSSALPYRGPEPLESFMEAIDYGLGKMLERSIVQDSVSIIGFDHEARTAIRRFGPFSPGLQRAALEDIRTVFAPIEELSAPSQERLRMRYEDHALFPRADARLSIPAALSEAYEIISSQNNFASSENWIILLTTGMTSCYREGGVRSNTPDNRHRCGNYQRSIQNVIDFAESYLVPANIKLHTIMKSPRVSPHEILRPSILGDGCASDNESFAFQNELTNSNPPGPDPSEQSATYDPNNLSLTLNRDQIFNLPNQLAVASFMTRGKWFPIRPACGGAGCNENNVLTDLDTACNTGTNPGFVDPQGRISCDTQCRSTRDQLTSNIDSIFSISPVLKVSDQMQVD